MLPRVFALIVNSFACGFNVAILATSVSTNPVLAGVLISLNAGLDAMGCAARQWHHRRGNKAMEGPMAKQNDLSRCRVTLEQDATVIVVIEIGQSSWLVAGIVPGLERNPLKKLDPDQDALLQLLHRWQKEAVQAGGTIKRIVVAYEAGRDGFWLARWLRTRE